jgi:hypothetical protein
MKYKNKAVLGISNIRINSFVRVRVPVSKVLLISAVLEILEIQADIIFVIQAVCYFSYNKCLLEPPTRDPWMPP